MIVKTQKCFHCGESSELEVDDDCYRDWQEGALIQVAFPNMSISNRELLMSGTHPECWEEMFKDD